jgi:hydroxyacylglutathione hydrolase
MSSDYQVATIVNGVWRQNCYLIINNRLELIIIDPGSNAQQIIAKISDLHVKPLAILNTHAHYDHIGAVSTLIQEYSIPFYLHKSDEGLMKQANLYKILFESKESIVIPSFDRDLSKGNGNLSIGDFKVEVIHTPGHTPGGVCLLVGKNIFVGDTLTSGGPGSTKLPGGNIEDMHVSINKLRQLPIDLLVYPGHGGPFDLNSFWRKDFASES